MLPWQKLSNNTKLTGLASMLVDASSEMIFPLLPFFLTAVLGAPVLAVGLMESLGEFATAVTSLLAGLYSDKIGKRKNIIILGYTLSGLLKGMFIIATAWPQVVLFKIIERVGKGMRESPRDALIALSEKPETLGQAYGYRKFMDNIGALIGPLLATIFLILFFNNTHNGENYRMLFAIALIPAVLGIVVLFFLKDQYSAKKPVLVNLKSVMANQEVVNFSVIMALFTIGQFSMMFFLLRANEFMPLYLIPVVYLVYNAAYTMFTLPAGLLIGRMGSRKTILFGISLFATAVFIMAFLPSIPTIFIAFLLTGCFMAIGEVVPQAFIVKRTEKGSHAATLGFYRSAVGIAALPANLLAGMLWGINILGAPAAFLLSLATSLAAGLLLFFTIKNGYPRK